MSPTAQLGPDGFARSGVWPNILTGFMILAMHVPWVGGEVLKVMPHIGIAAVFYWSVHHPEAVSMLAACLLGLFHDLLGSHPMGIMMLLYPLVVLLAGSQHLLVSNRVFVVGWLGFAVVAAVTMIISNILSMILVGGTPFWPAILQFVMTLLSYPLVAWFCSRLQSPVLAET